MNMQVINVYRQKETRVYIKSQDKFQFMPKKGKVWLQKLCFRILRKIGCFAEIEHVSYERIYIDGDNFLDQLSKQYSMFYERFETFPNKIYVGSKQFNEIARDQRAFQNGFSFTGRLGRNDGNGPYFRDVPIHIVPYLDGVLTV